MDKKIVLLGSTGSIGTQTLDVCRVHGFQPLALSGHSNTKLLEQQAREFLPQAVAVTEPSQYADLKQRLADLPVRVMAGREAVEELAAMPTADVVVNAISGVAGLRPTLAALRAGKQLALANKEALVVGGSLVMDAAKAAGTEILPIDSEHSAIWQCLRSGNRSELKSIILTASGGPFYGKSAPELEQVTLEDALAHPTWSMGQKITIDSATLMNKGLEFIEAMWLFDLKPEQIQVVVHRQSVIHSAVEFCDSSVIAQMGNPDMRVPIQYALTYPERLPLAAQPLSLVDYGTLTFELPDPDTFLCLASCIQAAQRGGFMPCIVNGANEAAVALFLERKITFSQIGKLVAEVLETVPPTGDLTLEALEGADLMAREFVRARRETL